MIKIILTLFLILDLSWAETPQKREDKVIATVVKMQGQAKLLPAKSIKKHTLKVGERLSAGDRLLTYSDSSAVLKFNDDSVVVLDENTRLLLASRTLLDQETGEVYYRIEKRTKNRGLQVKTPFSIIGIKGTEFIVNFEASGRIALNEGVIAITSPQKKFELYREQKMDAFKKYQQQQQEGFEAYKKRTEEQVAAYLVSFDLYTRKMLTFTSANNCKEQCESQVFEEQFSPEMVARFKRYQAMVKE